MRYIGSKSKLLDIISETLSKHLYGWETTFCDLFGGTNIVGSHFKEKFEIISNDLLYFSYINAKATIENNGGLTFRGLKAVGIKSPLAYLQEQANAYIHSDKINYYELNYSPTGEAQYFSVENAKRIDFIRDTIDEWRANFLITELEEAYLIACLLNAVPKVSNITGTYGAYLKTWDKRALKPLVLEPITVIDNHRHNKCFNEDSIRLANRITADITYIDTPYNNRQYASNYHLLENIAKNDKPSLHGKTRIFDWQYAKSEFSVKNQAEDAMNRLIQSIHSTHVMLSYSNEGLIDREALVQIIEKYAVKGTIEEIKIPYRKYKSKIPSESDSLYELLFYFQRKEGSHQMFSTKDERTNTLTKTSVWSCRSPRYIKSPLNYIGGKYKLLDQIIPLFPQNISTFLDLFSGGANVGINVSAKKYIFNDMNTRINELFRYFMSSDADSIISEIKEVIRQWGLSKENEEAYLMFRDYYNKNPEPILLYTLVSFSYNYQFRFNNAMQYNNPFGRNRSHFSSRMEENLRRFVTKLHEIDACFTDNYFEEYDYRSLSSQDFVYLDPPYLITTGSYNDGNRGFKNWGKNEETQLYKLLVKLNERDIRYALSNVIEHKGKENKQLIEFINSNDVTVHYLDFNYDNSSHNSKSKGSLEVLVTNY